jgi:hypothetical protein
MIGRTSVVLVIAAFVWAVPVAAQTSTTTAFDGKYVGVSRVSTRTPAYPGAKCPPDSVPAPLVITNGAVQTQGGGGLEGTVSSQGVLVVHAPNAARIEGQIDSQGMIRAQFGGTGCTISLVWRKQSG